jgi:hypothetical protein
MFHVEQLLPFTYSNESRTFEFMLETRDVPRGTLRVSYVRKFDLGDGSGFRQFL